MKIQRMWFQQDGSTSHTSKQKIDLLKDRFSNLIISRGINVNLPPISCDLTPMYFFLWGYLKEKVFATYPQTIKNLKEKIINEISGIMPQLCKNEIRNFYKRLKMCRSC